METPVVRASLVALTILLVGLAARMVGPGTTPWAGDTAIVAPAVPELDAAAGFVAAYASADPRGIARTASPLYRSELARRGIAGEAFLPVPWDDRSPPPVSPWLTFRYLDAIADAQGFTHAFYLVHARLGAGPQPTATLWRVDLDPAGRVIWGEMVFDLGGAAGMTVRKTTRVRLNSLPPVPIPLPLERRWPDLRPAIVLALRSTDGDAYFVLGLVPRTAPASDPLLPRVLIYFGADHAGKVVPGAWSYGEPAVRWVDSLHAEPVAPVPLATDAEPWRQEYLRTLWTDW